MNPAYQHLLDRIAATESRQRDLQRQLAEDTKQAIQLGIEQLFADHPRLDSFVWTQRIENEYDDNTYQDYTYIELRWIKLGEESWTLEYDDSMYEGNDPEAPLLEREIETFLARWEEELMIGLFGDYNSIVATKQGVETHGYDYVGGLS